MSDTPVFKINARFTVERELGRGGIGVAYLARDLEAGGGLVVVKVLLEQADPKVRAWIEKHFRDEAEALARISHPGVVKLVAVGETDEGKPYVAMDFVKATDLRSQIGSKGLTGGLERVARIIRELGAALSAAHDVGIYHRDLKPENILITLPDDDSDEHVKVIDFGIATVKNSLDEKTRATVLAGSVEYMAPEQLQGRPSATSDIYALGVIAYEMLTGRRPFTPDRQEPVAAMLQLLELQRGGVRVQPKDLRPSLPEGAQAVVLRALAFSPAERIGRADEFGEALAAALTPTSIEENGADGTNQLEMAYVLFCDIVGYSKLPMDVQAAYLRELQTLVQGLPQYREAQSHGQMVSLPTGDGMAMAFFGPPLRAVQCAVDLARQLLHRPHIRLRMGINAGMVYQVADINTNRNVAGGGINLAQRVMDFGDAGHILVSHSVAEMLLGLSEWADKVTDLGVHSAKHGVSVHVYNLVGADFGIAIVPERIRPKSDEVDRRGEVRRRDRRVALLAPAVVVAVVLIALGGWALYRLYSGPVPAPAERSLTYWATLQQYKGRTPIGQPIKMTGGVAGEAYFAAGDALTFYVTPSADGHLYMFNEERPADDGASKVNVLFPTEVRNGNSSAVRAGLESSTDELLFDATSGTERIWIIWSKEPVAQLEAVVRLWSNRAAGGEIRDVAEARSILRLLTESSQEPSRIEPDPEREAIVVRKSSDVIAVPLKLAHRDR